MTASSFDQQAWLSRIGYNGPLAPTLSSLHRLILAHSHAIAYESLDIMLGRTPRLDLASLQRKMVVCGRGGYCLEQNMLFREGLRSLGYKITSLQGRVVRGLAIDDSDPYAIAGQHARRAIFGGRWLPPALSCCIRASNSRPPTNRCALSISAAN
jgi:N-hydroxyarylamine O-acetyltransferase